MSWLSKAVRGATRLVTHPKRAIRNIGKSVGGAWEKVDDIALPALGFAIGGPGGAALGAAAARGIGDGRFDPGATLKAGAMGYAGGQLASGLPGLSNLGGSLSIGGAGGAGAATAAGGGGGLLSGGAGGLLKGVGRWALDNPELVLGGISAYQGAKQQSKANKLNEQALGLAREPWEETRALRSMALQGLTNNQAPDLSGIYEGMSNPFSRPLRSMGSKKGMSVGKAFGGFGRMG